MAKADMIVDALKDVLDRVGLFFREENKETKVMFLVGLQSDKCNCEINLLTWGCPQNTIILKDNIRCRQKSNVYTVNPEPPTARSAVPGVSPGRELLIPLGYIHPGKCEHREVQSHRSCHGRISSLCACASHH